MFDFDTLHYLNEQAHREANEHAKETQEPLLVLVKVIKSCGLPSIDTLVGMIKDSQSYADFVKLIDEYLPERKKEILTEAGPVNQIASFANHFEDRYFPLPDMYKHADYYEEITFDDLVSHIPLIPLGFGYDEYDNLVQDGHTGYRLMTYFFQQPYGEQGARVALADTCLEHVSKALLKRIPKGGYTPEELHVLLDDTPYKVLPMWGDALYLSTGNDFLNIDQEMLDNSVLPEWTKENVEFFTREWKKAERYLQQVQSLADMFEAEPSVMLKKVLDFTDKGKKERKIGRSTDK